MSGDDWAWLAVDLWVTGRLALFGAFLGLAAYCVHMALRGAR